MPQILTTNTRNCRSDPLGLPSASCFVTFQASLPDPVGTLHGPSRHLEGSQTAGVFHIFQRIVLSHSVRRPNWKWHKGMRGCPCHSSVLGSEITPILPGPLMLPVFSLLEETGRESKLFHSHLGQGHWLFLSSSSQEERFGVTAELSPVLSADKFSAWIKAGQRHVVIMAWGFEGRTACKIEINVSVLPQYLEN